MPALLLSILGFIVSSAIAKALLGAGLVIITYAWVDGLVEQAQVQVGLYLSGLPADVLRLASIAKIPQAFSVVMSAVGVASFIKMSKVVLGRAT